MWSIIRVNNPKFPVAAHAVTSITHGNFLLFHAVVIIHPSSYRSAASITHLRPSHSIQAHRISKLFGTHRYNNDPASFPLCFPGAAVSRFRRTELHTSVPSPLLRCVTVGDYDRMEVDIYRVIVIALEINFFELYCMSIILCFKICYCLYTVM